MKSFKKCCISSVVEGTGGDMLWNIGGTGGDTLWNVGTECVRKMKALTVKMETVTLSAKGR